MFWTFKPSSRVMEATPRLKLLIGQLLVKSNPRPESKAGVFAFWCGAGGRIRTGGLPLTRRLLYR